MVHLVEIFRTAKVEYAPPVIVSICFLCVGGVRFLSVEGGDFFEVSAVLFLFCLLVVFVGKVCLMLLLRGVLF